MTKKLIISVVVLAISVAFILGAVCAFGISNGDNFSKKTDDGLKIVTVKINNFEDGELWKNKAEKLDNGDAITGYVEYRDNAQYSKGTGVVAWYVGDGVEDIDAHHTKIVKTKFIYKNKDGKTKIKMVKGNEAPLIEGYTPVKAVVWYKEF